MANNSRVIIEKNSNEHISRLIHAGAAAIKSKTDSFATPEGTWGSEAKITFKSSTLQGDLYTVTLKSEELDFEFDIPFDDDLVANEGNIIVYNLSKETIEALNKIAKNDEHSVSINAGYKGDTGLIYKGFISKISTKRENADKVTTIKVTTDLEKRVVNKAFSSGTTAKQILFTLIDMLPYPKATIKTTRDHTYENDVTVDEPLSSAIKKFSEICGVSVFISRGSLYCCKLKEVDNTSVFEVSENTGMIGSPTPFVEESTTEEYEDKIEGVSVEMLLQHRLSTGAEIRLKSEQHKGTYYVKSGSHIFNESECLTTFEAIYKESYKVIEKEGG